MFPAYWANEVKWWLEWNPLNSSYQKR
jgi:hypothetical protein